MSNTNNIEAIYALSPVQQGMLFHSQLEPAAGVYFAQFCFTLTGELHVAAFQQAWQRIVDRHSVLRTLFVWENRTEPLQVVRRQATLPWDQQDWRAMSATEQNTGLSTFLAKDRRAGFDLQKPPLMRFTLIQLEEDCYRCIWSAHHLVLDGWSLPLLVREVMADYAAICRGEAGAHSAAQPYRAYIKWLETQDLAQAKAFWRTTLAGFTSPTALAVDQIAPPANGQAHEYQAHEYTEESVRLPVTIGTGLQSFARQHQLTLNTLLQGAWALLLSRYSGRDDVLFGTVVSGRPAALPGVAAMVGPFINTLPLRVAVAPDTSLLPWLQQLQERLADLRQFEHSPLVDVQQWSELPHNQPLFSTVFALENYPADALHLGQLAALQVTDITSIEQNSYPLSLMVVPGDELWLRVLYDGTRFDQATVQRLLGHYRTLLAGMLANPHGHLRDLPLLTQAEETRLLASKGEDEQFAQAEPIHQRFAKQAARRPNAIAVRCDDQELTYAALNARANRLAHYLQERGVGPEDRVGLLLDRSPEMIVAILATLKAGAAYLPLDPVYPPERLAYILADAKTPLVLTQQSLADRLSGVNLQLTCLDQVEQTLDGVPTTDPVSQSIAANTAYVIYTSGSTGQPKGVVVSHANVTRLFAATASWYNFNEHDVWTLFHSYAFDFSVWEIWGALLYGGQLVIVPHAISRTPTAFYRLLRKEGVTVLNQTPSAFRQLIQAEEEIIENQTPASDEPVGDELSLPHLRLVIFGGEALELQSLRPWFDRHGDEQPQLVNMYGITETTVHVTYRPLTVADLERTPASLIGGPIPDLQLYLLDRYHRPVPAGVPGELYVGGAGVARGYLGRPDLTADRFVPDPFSRRPGARLYKTGDLARYLPTATEGALELEYLGRIDHQVKIRGFRIELGEIEAALVAHPAVREAVVLAHANSADDVRLSAYLVPDQQHARPVREILRLTREGLVNGHPRYELPNGMTVFYKNRSETDFMYREIFEEHAYLKHGITLDPESCIFDVGANMGIFALQIGQLYPDATIHAFEPVPAIFELLCLNTTLYGLKTKLYNCGLAASEGQDTFTFYPEVSVMSGRFADGADEHAVISSFLMNEDLELANTGEASLVDEMLTERLHSQTITAQFRTISSVMAEEQVAHIDLLKIDVEKSELDVLRGIDTADWPKIRQIVLEVHDREGRLQAITELLSAQGYAVTVEQEQMLSDTGLFSVYATRDQRVVESVAAASSGNGTPPNGSTSPPAQPRLFWSSDEQLRSAVRSHLQQRLPDYMVPSSLILLDALPLTPNGKVDRRVLPTPDQTERAPISTYVPARNATEELLAELWAAVLNLEQVGIHDDFFALGGHSLLATQLVARIRKSFNVELPLAVLFAAPTVATLAAEILDQHTEQPTTEPALVPVTAAGPPPLSFAQERLWVLAQIEPESPAYNIATAVRLRGTLNLVALTTSFQRIVARHAALRTTVQTVEGQTVQVIAPHAPIEITRIDLSDLAGAEQDAALQERAATAARSPFDPTHGPLLRLVLLQLGDGEHVLLITMHHLISDGWSMRILAQEFTHFYRALAGGHVPDLPPLPIQYSDFAHWQRSWLTGDPLAAQLAYWTEQLNDLPTLLKLPTDRPRPAMQSYNGAVHEFTVAAPQTAALRHLSRQENVTLFMTLLAAWQILLYRYTGQTKIAVGTPVANRNRVETEGLIGFFANTLVLRGDLSGNPTVRRFLEQVRAMALGAFAHQDLPFERLVATLRPDREMSHSPLFQVMFAMQDAPLQEHEVAGLAIASSDLHNGTAKFDLTLFVTDEGETLRCALEYNTDLFAATTVQRMVNHLQTLFEGIVADPSRRVAALPLLEVAERDQLLRTWNGRKQEWPFLPVHELFAAQATHTPDQIAAVCGDAQLTYAELDQRANQLAAYLQAQGVGPDVLVGIQLERSLTMLIALLGTLKAGGAYLPLDPKLPDERLAFMIDDAKPHLVLTAATVQAALAGTEPTAHDPSPALHSQHLAYVIYTSGSTGLPKGTLITHGGLTNYLHWCLEAYPLDKGCGALVHSTIAFDATITGLFSPLLVGGAVHLLPETDDIEALSNAMRARQSSTHEKFSLIKITPAHLEVLNHLVPAAEAKNLTHAFVIGGENLLAEQVAFWQRHAPDTLLFNEYGPTETVVGCVVYEGVKWRGKGNVPIGRAIPNTSVYVLDRNFNPVPIGVPGELYISGAGVARGYLNRPGTSAERFVPDPFSQQPGTRMYRTGDLVRYRSDGQLECLGRLDNQVKIRGYRVELGEIEARLCEHPDVREAVVVVQPGAHGEKRLAAYFTTGEKSTGEKSTGEKRDESSRALAGNELRTFLQQQLPDYMIPRFFVPLLTLPLTQNGKVDRQALPEPEQSRLDPALPFAAPAAPAEAALAEIWQQALGVEQVGRHDNFFELGGDSIIAIQTITQANAAGLGLTPKQLFLHPTIAELAAVAGTARVVAAEQGLISGPVPLTPIQHWFFAQALATPQHWNQSLLLALNEPLDTALLPAVLEALVYHHDALRLRFHRTDASAEQTSAKQTSAKQNAIAQKSTAPDAQSFAFAVADLAHLSPSAFTAAIEAAAAEEQAALDLANGPLLRALYVHGNEQCGDRLLLIIHHLVIDGVSWRILLTDFLSSYEQVRNAQPIQLPPKTTAFQTWAQRLVDYAAAPALHAEVDWWLKLPWEQVAPLPLDMPAGENLAATTAQVQLSLSIEETEALLHAVPAAYHTDINDLLLAALAQSLSQWTGASHLLIDVESHGRADLFAEQGTGKSENGEFPADVDLSRTVGWFTTVYPLLLELGRSLATPGDLLKAVKEQCRRTPQQGIGFGLLRHLAPPAVGDALRNLPQAQVSFNYLGQLDHVLPETGSIRQATESSGPNQGPQNRRPYLIDLLARVQDGQLQVAWLYSTALYEQATIMQLAETYQQALQATIAHCLNADDLAITATDVDEFGWDQQDLDEILAEVANTAD